VCPAFKKEEGREKGGLGGVGWQRTGNKKQPCRSCSKVRGAGCEGNTQKREEGFTERTQSRGGKTGPPAATGKGEKGRRRSNTGTVTAGVVLGVSKPRHLAGVKGEQAAGPRKGRTTEGETTSKVPSTTQADLRTGGVGNKNQT